ncbi:MAG: heme exporter protein CcmB [Alphaproteobacteria bacterium]|nr:heme exporter protein CcmB [Alphaproteobacteria bacterium]
MNTLLGVLARDLKLAIRQIGDATTVLVFFTIAVALFPFGLGPDPVLLKKIAPGILWVTALLAALLSLDRLFEADHADGTLEQLALSPAPLEAIVAVKALAHWLTTGLPLALMAPLLGILLGLTGEGSLELVLSLLIGTPTISLIGAVGAAVTLGARRSGVLVALLILPLTIPVLIFGVGAVDAAITALDVAPHLAFLGALLAGSLALTPWASAAALRLALR